ncbi:MAG: hypothetical protein ACHBN1_01780 [Heteroscytonema crispum UTEX LB 1556]
MSHDTSECVASCLLSSRSTINAIALRPKVLAFRGLVSRASNNSTNPESFVYQFPKKRPIAIQQP